MTPTGSFRSKLIKLGILVTVLVGLLYCIYRYRLDVVFTYEVFDITFSGRDKLPYRFFEPLEKAEGKKYPMIFFLHGAGSRASDNKRHLMMLQEFLLDSTVRAKYPCYLFAPQCMKNPYQWSDMRESLLTSPLSEAEKVMKKLIRQHDIDTNRIYLLGYSMGASGAWETMIYHPDRYAAAITLSGWSYPDKAEVVKHIPVWAFHGGKDEVVNPESIRDMVQKLKSMNAPIRYTEYPDTGHESFIKAFKEKDLLPWLFTQKKFSAEPVH